ncbi:hypothetical protein [Chryseolinea lacunae]|uniref:DUF4345 domain-containing protein n=1 Tax=Chryseolinea lacunae TaxID=2801331 RepID=A0ABS1KMK5_9BACT|nr:hypothetical protein [Chryseolinea lacunae]MBL0740699.1 hypothetical protein [Chryseolinea lacunae]
MEKSRSIAGIAGPTLVVMVLAELKMWNPTLYDSQITPLVYLSGVLFFVAGLAIVRSHSIWTVGWQTSLTILGWLAILLGMARMFFPELYKSQFKNDGFTFAIELLLIGFGVFLTFKAYSPLSKANQK